MQKKPNHLVVGMTSTSTQVLWRRSQVEPVLSCKDGTKVRVTSEPARLACMRVTSTPSTSFAPSYSLQASLYTCPAAGEDHYNSCDELLHGRHLRLMQ